MNVGQLWVQLGLEAKGFEQGLKDASAKIAATGAKMKSVGTTMTMGLTLPLMAAGGAAFKFSSDLDEALNKTNVAFKDSAREVIKWSETTLNSIGMAQGTALDAASLFGDMATSMGLVPTAAADMSISLTELSADLASFKNVSVDQASTALKGIFTGESESLKTLGIIMTQAQLETYALANGYTKLMKDMTQAEVVQLRYAYVMDATKNAQGDFSRTSDGAANQMRIFTESLKQTSATFGSVLLPIITPVINKINEMLMKISQLSETQKKWVVGIGGVVAAMGPLLMVSGSVLTKLPALASGFGKLIGVMGKVTAAMSANPYLAVAAAIVALIAIFAIWGKTQEDLVKDWETVKQAFKDADVINKVGAVFKSVFGDLKTLFTELWSIFGGVGTDLDMLTGVFEFFTFTVKLAYTPLRMLISVIKSVVVFFKKLYNIFADIKNFSLAEFFNVLVEAVFSAIEPILDLLEELGMLPEGLANIRDSFKKTATTIEATAVPLKSLEEQAKDFANTFVSATDAEKAAIESLRKTYLQAATDMIKADMAKRASGGLMDMYMSPAEMKALLQPLTDAFNTDLGKINPTFAPASNTGGGGAAAELSDADKLEQKLKEIRVEYGLQNILLSDKAKLLDAELTAVNGVFDAYKEFAGADGAFTDAEIEQLQIYQLGIDNVTQQIAKLEAEKQIALDKQTMQQQMEGELAALKESLMTEEELFEASWAKRAEIIYSSGLSIEEMDVLFAKMTSAMNAELATNETAIVSWADTWKSAAQEIDAALESTMEGIVGTTAEMIGAGASMNDIGKMVMGTMADLAIQVGKIAIGTAIAVGGIAAALDTLNPVVALAAGVALVTLGSFVKSQLKSAGDVQGLATGGSVTSGGIFKVGENGEELVNLPTGSAVTPNHMLNGGSGFGDMELTTRISGRDLEVVLQRTQSQTKRR